MSIRLLIKQRSATGGADTATEALLHEDSILLGRDPACQVVLAEQAVSRNHARISKDGTLYFIEDLGSSFGTQINGRKLPKGEKRLLKNGDVIAIAQFDVTFDRVMAQDAGQNSNNPGTVAVARQVVKDVMKGLSSQSDSPYFRVMNGAQEGQRIELPEAREWVVGRDDTADIVLRDDLVSRRHVKIRRDWSGTHVEDLGSRNGIRINGTKAEQKTLKDRDELEIGNIRLLYLDPSEVRESPVVLPDEDNGEKTNFNRPEALEEDAEEASEAPPEDAPFQDEEAPNEEMGNPEEPLPAFAPQQSVTPAPMPKLETKTWILLGVTGLVALSILGLVVAILVGA